MPKNMKNEYITIALTMDDGSVSIMTFITKEYRRPPLTDAQKTAALNLAKQKFPKSPKSRFDQLQEELDRYGVNWEKEPTPENIQAEINRAQTAWVNKVVSWRIIADAEIPVDRTYRNAWVDKGAKIDHDMTKVVSLELERIRADRKPVMDDLDAQYMRAIGQKNEVEAAAVEAKRQELRDLPATILPELQNAKTVDEVKAIKKII